MGEPRDIENLVRRVTDAVLQQLGPSDPQRPVWWLLPLVPRQPQRLAAARATLERTGQPQRLFAPQLQLELLSRAGLPGAEALEAGGPPAGESPRALVIGALGFAFTGRLLALDDADPAVRLVTGALLSGVPAAMLDDDLRSAPAVGALGRRAEERLRELVALGLERLALDGLSGWLHRLRAAGETLSQAASGLVTESDVEAWVAAGERRLVLGPRSIVTPLARSRAAALGLELVETRD